MKKGTAIPYRRCIKGAQTLKTKQTTMPEFEDSDNFDGQSNK
jgi:hypothetical protein